LKVFVQNIVNVAVYLQTLKLQAQHNQNSVSGFPPPP